MAPNYPYVKFVNLKSGRWTVVSTSATPDCISGAYWSLYGPDGELAAHGRSSSTYAPIYASLELGVRAAKRRDKKM